MDDYEIIGIKEEYLESRNNTAASGDSDELDLGASNPSDGGQLVLKKKMVGLIVEAPLADGEVGSSILHLFDHFFEFLALVCL